MVPGNCQSMNTRCSGGARHASSADRQPASMSHPIDPYSSPPNPVTRIELKNRLGSLKGESPVRLHGRIDGIIDAIDARGLEGCGPSDLSLGGPSLPPGPPLGGHMPPRP
jgi:hypothetical protein